MVDYNHPNAVNIPQQPQEFKSKSLNHAEKRANHNAIERARRESLNIRFLELAASLPSLQHVRKPSKAVIVGKSIEFIQEAKQRLDVKTRSLQLIRQQNEELKREINQLRQELGKAPVLFPDNIDMDLVFEANLEHQKELELSQPDHRYVPSPGLGSFRTGSPMDLLEEDDEDDKKSSFGSAKDDKRLSQGSYPISVSQPMVSSPLTSYFPQVSSPQMMSPIQFQPIQNKPPMMSALSRGMQNQQNQNQQNMQGSNQQNMNMQNSNMHQSMSNQNMHMQQQNMNQQNMGMNMQGMGMNMQGMTMNQGLSGLPPRSLSAMSMSNVQMSHPQAIQIQNQNHSGSFHEHGLMSSSLSQSMTSHPVMTKYEMPNMAYQFEPEQF
jgi:hypothetical protein